MDKHYATLGLRPGASLAEVKAAYRSLVKTCHPDTHPGDSAAEERFKAISTSFAALEKDHRARRPDAQAASGHKSSQASPVYAHAHAPRRPSPGRGHDSPQEQDWGEPQIDIVAEVGLSLLQAYQGTRQWVDAQSLQACTHCHGNGVVAGPAQPCHACMGTGLTQWGTRCRQCGATGLVHKPVHCRTCAGKGVRLLEARIEVSIPAGVDDGDVLVFGRNQRGTGQPGIRISVKPSRRFARRGADLLVVRKVRAARAARGTSLTLRCIDDKKVRIRIAAATLDGTVLRVRGQGMPRTDGSGRGDLLVSLQVSPA